MLDFDHPNVLKLLGVCFDHQLPLLILPYMANGDLKNYLITARGEDDMLPKVTLIEDHACSSEGKHISKKMDLFIRVVKNSVKLNCRHICAITIIVKYFPLLPNNWL